jgi:hypothetical protein
MKGSETDVSSVGAGRGTEDWYEEDERGFIVSKRGGMFCDGYRLFTFKLESSEFVVVVALPASSVATRRNVQASGRRMWTTTVHRNLSLV